MSLRWDIKSCAFSKIPLLLVYLTLRHKFCNSQIIITTTPCSITYTNMGWGASLIECKKFTSASIHYISQRNWGMGTGGTDISVKWFGLKQLWKWSKWTVEFIFFQEITKNPCINSSDIQVPIESNSWINSKQIWGCRAGTCYQLCLFFPANAGRLSANLHFTAARIWTAEKKLSCS